MHNGGFYARYGRDLYFVSRDLTALSEQLKKYDFRLGVVEVVGSNPAGPIDENPAITLVFAGFFRILNESIPRALLHPPIEMACCNAKQPTVR